MKLRACMKLRAQKRSDTDDVAAISRERIDIRKRAEHKKTITEPGKSKYCTNLEYHQEKAGQPRIRRKRKCPATQDLQHGLGILEHEKTPNQRMIQMTCKELRESQATRRKHETQAASKMTVTSKARKCRKNRPRRPRSPSISSYHTSNCFAPQETSANSSNGTRILDGSNYDTIRLNT
jgi:hypothetical protein